MQFHVARQCRTAPTAAGASLYCLVLLTILQHSSVCVANFSCSVVRSGNAALQGGFSAFAAVPASEGFVWLCVEWVHDWHSYKQLLSSRCLLRWLLLFSLCLIHPFCNTVVLVHFHLVWSSQNPLPEAHVLLCFCTAAAIVTCLQEHCCTPSAAICTDVQ